MIFSLNKKSTKRFKYYYSRNLKTRSSFFFINHFIIFSLISMLFISFYFLSTSKKDLYIVKNYEINKTKENKINNLLITLNDIFKNNHFTSKELTELSKHIINNSKKYNIEPELILAIISVESSFNKNAISYVGARGLMQLMPNTFKEVAKELGIKYSGLDTIHKIQNNISSGTYYLYKLKKKYKNNMEYAISAYNWGPSNIDRFLKTNAQTPKGYYKKVMRYYKEYIL